MGTGRFNMKPLVLEMACETGDGCTHSAVEMCTRIHLTITKQLKTKVFQWLPEKTYSIL